MRKTIIRLLRSVLLSLAVVAFGPGLTSVLSSCSIETSDNGDLDGFWHLERIDTIATGGINDLSAQPLFWSVNNKLLMLKGSGSSYYLRFRQTDDSLVVFSPYLEGGHEDVEGGGDHPVGDPTALWPYGIRRLEEHFVKESLGGSHMVLRSPELRLYFRKF